MHTITLANRLFSVFNASVWTLLGVFVFLLAAISLPQLNLPHLSYQAYVIKSGSMEPTILTGDLLFIHKKPSYSVGDIVTFQIPGDPVITHRIISTDPVNSTSFITKGDHNEDPDIASLDTQSILGVAIFRLPAVGYALVYSKTPLGMLLLIGLPITLVLIESVFFPKKRPVVNKHQSTASPNVS